MARAYAWAIFVFGGRTLSVAYGDSSPEGRALGKEGNSRPYRSTTRRSQLISAKLFAPAKASPFRERWHGGAVTERVGLGKNPLRLAALDSCSPFCRLVGEGGSGTNPFRHFALRNATSPEGGGLGKKGNSRPYRSTPGGNVSTGDTLRTKNPWRDGVSAPDLHFLFFRQKLFFPFVQLRLIFCSLGDIWPVLVCKCRGVPP